MKIAIDADLVRRLVAGQFPHWADLPIGPVEHGGWNNKTFHLGDRMSVRLPRAWAYAAQTEKEFRWLPRLRPHLPVPIPEPLALGEPAEGYPWRWSIYRWIEGDAANRAEVADKAALARALAGFLRALHGIDPAGGPLAGAHNFQRGVSPVVYDGQTREALVDLGDRIDGEGAWRVWETALAAEFAGPPVWFHGDVAAGNLLVRDGRLAAVIDFGISGVGDPACDLTIAWTYLEGESRAVFRQAMDADPGAWARARAWALWKALILMADPTSKHPDALTAPRVLEAVIADHRAFD